MRILALDIGNRRTGVAYLDDAVGIPLPLDTLSHTSHAQLLAALQDIIRARKIDRILVGLPLLPSGDEGTQAQESRAVGSMIATTGITVEYCDERYTTPKNSSHKNALPVRGIDGDATAACELLNSRFL